MEPPALVRFQDRLVAVLSAARRHGAIGAREYEALLVDPDFDDETIERFRARALAEGIGVPEDAEPAPGDAALRGLQGEPERDLLDLYLHEIGRVALLPHEPGARR